MLFTQGAESQLAAICVSVSVIVGFVPHVTFTLVESSLFVVAGSGPMTNAAAPAGGGVRLSRSDGIIPSWGLLPYFFRSF